MEFCEKSTLRDYINAGLCGDISRVWQLFREIVEGLVHIHEQVSLFNCTFNVCKQSNKREISCAKILEQHMLVG